MENKSVPFYEKYLINSAPCWWWTRVAVDEYNDFVSGLGERYLRRGKLQADFLFLFRRKLHAPVLYALDCLFVSNSHVESPVFAHICGGFMIAFMFFFALVPILYVLRGLVLLDLGNNFFFWLFLAIVVSLPCAGFLLSIFRRIVLARREEKK